MPFAQVNGASLYFKESGAGIPIVWVHPPLMTSKIFTVQHEQLANEFRVISFDIRGHGQSQPSRMPIDYAQISDDIVALLDLLQIEKCFIGGYSTGGTVTLETMLSYPDRFYGGIQLSTMPEVSHFYLKMKLNLAIVVARMRAMRLLTWSLAYGNANNRHMYKHLYDDALTGDLHNITEYFEYSLRYRCTDYLDRLELPQLLIYGQRDTSFLRYAYMMMQRLPHSEVYLVPRQSHQLPTKAGTQVGQLVRHWIRNQPIYAEHSHVRRLKKTVSAIVKDRSAFACVNDQANIEQGSPFIDRQKPSLMDTEFENPR